MNDTPPQAAPRVSVIVPAYNAQRVIARAIDSVLAQDYSPLEILVVNDASGDATAEIVQRYAERGVRLIDMPVNSGASASRNVGIHAATGEYVAFLDSDDEWLPGKISAQVAAFRSTPGCTLVVCDGDWIAPDGSVEGHGLTDAPDSDNGEAWREMLRHSFIHTSCAMARRDQLLELGGFDTGLVVAEDWDLWVRLGLKGRYGFVRQSLARVHVTPGSLMNREARNARKYLLPMIQRHLNEQRHRLGRRERRRIWAAQLERLGRVTCEYGNYWVGAGLLLRAMLLGKFTPELIKSLIATFPPVRRLRGG